MDNQRGRLQAQGQQLLRWAAMEQNGGDLDGALWHFIAAKGYFHSAQDATCEALATVHIAEIQALRGERIEAQALLEEAVNLDPSSLSWRKVLSAFIATGRVFATAG